VLNAKVLLLLVHMLVTLVRRSPASPIDVTSLPNDETRPLLGDGHVTRTYSSDHAGGCHGDDDVTDRAVS